jgi:hypothetical protein
MPLRSNDADYVMVPLDGEVVAETDLAWKFDTGSKQVWLPKSRCEWDGAGEMLVPQWLVNKAELA